MSTQRFLARAEAEQKRARETFPPGIPLLATFVTPGYQELENQIRYGNPFDIPKMIDKPPIWYLDYVETLEQAEQLGKIAWRVNQERPNPFSQKMRVSQ